VCVTAAVALCGPPECPWDCPADSSPEPEPCGKNSDGGCNVEILGDSTCCHAHPTAGCDQTACQSIVCAIDPFCCAVAWDEPCVQQAVALCADVCSLGTPSFAPILCGQTICGTAWALNGTRDTDWYEIELAELTQIALSVSTTIPMIIAVVDTGGIPLCELAVGLSSFDTTGLCGDGVVIACLPAGTWWLFAAPDAFDGFPCGALNDYAISLACAAPPLVNADAQALADEGLERLEAATGDLSSIGMKKSEVSQRQDQADEALLTALGDLDFAFELLEKDIECLGASQVISDAGDAVLEARAAIFAMDAPIAAIDSELSALSASAQQLSRWLREIPPQGQCERARTKAKRVLEKIRKQKQGIKQISAALTSIRDVAGAGFTAAELAQEATELAADAVEKCSPGDVLVQEALGEALFSIEASIPEFNQIKSLATQSIALAESAIAALEDIPSLATKAAAAVCGCPGCGSSDHNCFTEGEAYCSDALCCETVCAIDPFCCQTAWDALCVQEAKALCVG